MFHSFKVKYENNFSFGREENDPSTHLKGRKKIFFSKESQGSFEDHSQKSLKLDNNWKDLPWPHKGYGEEKKRKKEVLAMYWSLNDLPKNFSQPKSILIQGQNKSLTILGEKVRFCVIVLFSGKDFTASNSYFVLYPPPTNFACKLPAFHWRPRYGVFDHRIIKQIRNQAMHRLNLGLFCVQFKTSCFDDWRNWKRLDSILSGEIAAPEIPYFRTHPFSDQGWVNGQVERKVHWPPMGQKPGCKVDRGEFLPNLHLHDCKQRPILWTWFIVISLLDVSVQLQNEYYHDAWLLVRG